MHGSRLGLALGVWIMSIGAAWTQPTPPGSVRIKEVTQDIVVSPDGRSEANVHSEMQILTAAAVTAMSQIPLTYNATTQDAQILEAHTQKTDGRRIPVDPGNIVVQKAPSVALSSMYNDTEEKVIIFPNVEPGDTLVLSAKLSDRTPIIPGGFSLAHYFSTAVEADDARYSLTVPKAMVLAVDSHGMAQDSSTQGDTVTFRWTYSNLTPKARTASPVFEPDSEPHFAASTFHDYDALAHSLAGRMLSKITVTPAVQKQADIITAGIGDPREQAHSIYNWVNQHVRYIAIELGVGGIIPHEADWTLTNAFGDCKDQAVLFAALLKAKGIPAELVLINSANHYRLARIPTLGDFNHMIVWLPKWHLYADTTAARVDFGLLPMPDYGKPVVHLVGTGTSEHNTPAVAPGVLNSTFTVHAVMDAQRQFAVDTLITATGPWENGLRKLGTDIQKLGPAAVASAILKAHRFSDALGVLNVTPTSASTTGYSLSGTFHTGRMLTDGNVFALANGLRVLERTGDGPMGPLENARLTNSDETLCYSARQTEEITVDLSSGEHLARVPPDVHVKTASLSYNTHWSVEGDRVSVHRDFVSKIDHAVCSGQTRIETAAALEAIRADYAAATTLAPHDNSHP